MNFAVESVGIIIVIRFKCIVISAVSRGCNLNLFGLIASLVNSHTLFKVLLNRAQMHQWNPGGSGFLVLLVQKIYTSNCNSQLVIRP